MSWLKRLLGIPDTKGELVAGIGELRCGSCNHVLEHLPAIGRLENVMEEARSRAKHWAQVGCPNCGARASVLSVQIQDSNGHVVLRKMIDL